MNRQHLIEEAVFDISFASEAVARQRGQGMDDFIQHRLLANADEILSELSTEGTVARIELLEIDLGDIADSDLHEEMATRFTAKLRSAIREKLQAISHAPSGTEGIFTVQHTEFEQLQYFLETGRKRGNAGSRNDKALEKLLEDALRHKGKEFAEFLKGSSRQKIVLKRLSKQFSETTLIQVLELLAPAHAGFFAERLRKPDGIPENKASGVREPEDRRLIFEKLFNTYLETASKLPKPGKLFRKITATLSSPGLEIESSGVQTRESADENFFILDGKALPDVHLPSEKLLRTLLEEALVTGRVAGIAEEWPALLRDHAAMVRELFGHRLGDASSQERLAKGFPEPMLLQLGEVVRPGEAAFIGKLLRQPELRHAEADEKDVLLWRYTLSWLHTSGESKAGRADYVRGLLDTLMRVGISHNETLKAVKRLDATVAEMLKIEVKGDTPVEQGIAATGRKALLKRLEQRLSGEGTTEVVQEIEALATDHAEKLTKLLRRWDARSSGKAWERLTAGELRALARFLIEWHGQGESGDFLREVAQHAARAKSESGYYQYVLQKLLRGEAVDLVEAQLRSTTSEDKALPSEALLRTRLEEALITGRAAGMEEAWPSLLRDHAAMVREVFEHRLGDVAAQRHLAEGFPESMLLGLIGLLQPGEKAFIEALLQQPELHRSEADKKDVLLWRYTLSWMHASDESKAGRKDYVRGLIAELESAGVDRTRLLRVIKRLDVGVARALETEVTGETSVEQSVTAKSRKALLKRLEQRLSGEGSTEVVQEIEALATDHATQLVRLLERWDARSSGKTWEKLTAGELRALARFLIEWHGQGESDDFLREVARYAARAKSEAGYYRHILQNLLRGEVIDLVETQSRSETSKKRKNAKHREADEARALDETPEEKGVAAKGRKALLKQLERRLSGDGMTEVVQEIEKLATVHAEKLAQLLERWAMQASREMMKHLTAGELRALTYFMIEWHGQNESGDFLREVERHVSKAESETDYFLYILLKLLRSEAVDLVEAAKSATPGQHLEENVPAAKKLSEISEEQVLPLKELLRTQLEETLVTGRVAGIAEEWAALLRDHKAIVREVFAHRLGDMSSQKRLAEGFPESMLLDLVGVLQPGEETFIEALLRQPELRRSETDEKPLSLWKYTLAWLHAPGGAEADRANYVHGLIAELERAGVERTEVLRLLTHFLIEWNGQGESGDFLREVKRHASKAKSAAGYYDYVLQKLLRDEAVDLMEAKGAVAEVHLGENSRSEASKGTTARSDADVTHALSETSGEKGVTSKDRKALLKSLENRLSGKGSAEVAQEIEALAANHAKRLSQLLKRWDDRPSGEAWKRLTTGELRALTRFLVEWNGQGDSGDFLREMERHASKASNESGYYRYVLQQLLRSEDVDLSEATLSGKTAEGEVTALRLEEETRSEVLEDTTLSPEELLRTRLEEALITGHAAGIAEAWPALLRDHAAMVRELFGHRLGDASSQERLAKGFPETMLLELVGVLQPGEKPFIEALLRQPELRRSETDEKPLSLWRHTLAWLHASGDAETTDRANYVHGLIAELERAGAERAEGVRALANFLIAWNSQGESDDFLREVTRHAPDSKNEVGYYLYILQNLLEEKAVDLVQAAESEATELPFEKGNRSERSKTNKDPAADSEKTPLKQLERRFFGKSSVEMVREIETLAANHAKQLAQLLKRWDTKASGEAWKRLTTGELRTLTRFLIEWNGQGDSGDFLREVELHALKASSEAGYYRHILQNLLKSEAVDLMAAALSKETAESDTATEKEVAAQDGKNLLNRLEKRLSGEGTTEVVQEIEALAAHHARPLSRLLEKWNGRSSEEARKRLTVGELRVLTRFLIEWHGQGESDDFLREVARYAARAKSEAGYYRHILQNLLRGEAVDLVEATLSEERAGGDVAEPVLEKDMREEEGRFEVSLEKPGAVEEEARRDESPEESGEIYIANAGMVLMAPYLPRLFDMLELTEAGEFKNAAATERAIHLMQFAVNESSDSPEFLLTLNKILCGIRIEMPIVREIDPLPREKEAIEGMLAAMIQNWPIIKNTSVQGLRESFLQRNGRLLFEDEAWRLNIEQKGIDVLLDQLPWSYSIVKYPWMRWPVYVEWR